VGVIVGFVGNGVRRLVARSVEAAGGPSDERSVDHAVALFLERYGDHLLDTTVPYRGVLDAVGRLRAAGAVLSIATNKPEAMARRLAAALGFADDFFAVLGGDSMPSHKPDPAIVDALVERARIAKERTVLVGDSPVDVATARAAGIAVCAVTWGLTPADVLLATKPDHVVETPDQLLRLVA
jgi:phosphoglycolate phosphatase